MFYGNVITALRTVDGLIPNRLAAQTRVGMRYNALGILLNQVGVSDAELLEMAQALPEDIYGRWAFDFLDHYGITESDAIELDFASQMTGSELNTPKGRLIDVIGYVSALKSVDRTLEQAMATTERVAREIESIIAA